MTCEQILNSILDAIKKGNSDTLKQLKKDSSEKTEEKLDVLITLVGGENAVPS